MDMLVTITCVLSKLSFRGVILRHNEIEARNYLTFFKNCYYSCLSIVNDPIPQIVQCCQYNFARFLSDWVGSYKLFLEQKCRPGGD